MTDPAPIRVVHTVRTTDPRAGGFVTYVANLRKGLAGRPFELATECVFPSNRNWRVLALHFPLHFMLRMRRCVRDADGLHVHGIFGWHVLLSAWTAKAMRLPYVLTLHGHLHPDAMRERRTSKRLYLALAGKRILNRASAVLVTVPAEAAYLRSHAPDARVAQVMPGLDVPPEPQAEVALSDPAPTRPMKVLYLGRLHPHKGLPLMLHSLAHIHRHGSCHELIVAGSGPKRYRRSFVRLAARLGIADRVHFLGHVDAVKRSSLFKSADLFVLPSRSENFGFAVAEAMAAGVPVVISENVGLAPLVEKWRCGRVVPPQDVDALQRTILEYENPQLRRRHGRRAHAAAREEFSIPGMGRAMERIYLAIGRTQCN